MNNDDIKKMLVYWLGSIDLLNLEASSGLMDKKSGAYLSLEEVVKYINKDIVLQNDEVYAQRRPTPKL